MRHLLTLLATALPAIALPAIASAAESYRVETVSFPPNIVPEVGGLGFAPTGELVVALRRYGILMAKPTSDPAAFAWRSFSDDILHNACGLQVISAHEVVVSTMDDLVRITDTDGDGVADRYDTICDAWGMSGSYHETNTIAPDGSGGWWIALGTASYNGTVFSNVRGEFSPIGRRGRNFSAVPWKGWVAHIDAHGAFAPYAKGFRMANGIAVAPDGKLYATDNQGDWRGSNPLYHVQKDHFYGHPSSLVWDTGFHSPDGDPLKLPLATIEAMRTQPAVEFPEGTMCNSPGEPCFDTTGGRFGPFAGQMLVGDVAGGRLLRVMLEEVDSTMQGACVLFVDKGVRPGNNRLVFSPDGTTLYTGQTLRGWGKPAEGMQRIIFTGTVPFEVASMSLRSDGFALTFTKPIDKAVAADPSLYQVGSSWFSCTPQYGSPPRDRAKLAVSGVTVGEDGRSVHIKVDGMQVDRIVELQLDPRLVSTTGEAIAHPKLCYKINRLRK